MADLAHSIGDLMASVRVQRFDVEALCSCGAPVAGHHYEMDDTIASHSPEDIAAFFQAAFESHVTREHRGYQLHMRVVNVAAETHLITPE